VESPVKEKGGQAAAPDYSKFDLRATLNLSSAMAAQTFYGTSKKEKGPGQVRQKQFNYTQYMDDRFCLTFLPGKASKTPVKAQARKPIDVFTPSLKRQEQTPLVQ